jgi:hypothetical protein
MIQGDNMPIPFPKIHIAESVLNRMMNAIEDIEPMFPSINAQPIPPADPIALGQQIEEQTSVPPQPVSMPQDPVEAGAAVEGIFGGSPLAGAVDGML